MTFIVYDYNINYFLRVLTPVVIVVVMVMSLLIYLEFLRQRKVIILNFARKRANFIILVFSTCVDHFFNIALRTVEEMNA